MNRYDFFVYCALFCVYVLVGWLTPLAMIGGFDNRWFNVIAFHSFILAIVGFLFAVSYAASKSKNFRGY